MLLKQKHEGHLLEVITMDELINPNHRHISGQLDYGEEIQDPERFAKEDLSFPSGEALPRCWIDPHYRDAELNR